MNHGDGTEYQARCRQCWRNHDTNIPHHTAKVESDSDPPENRAKALLCKQIADAYPPTKAAQWLLMLRG
jgi:hypothetical protein